MFFEFTEPSTSGMDQRIKRTIFRQHQLSANESLKMDRENDNQILLRSNSRSALEFFFPIALEKVLEESVFLI